MYAPTIKIPAMNSLELSSSLILSSFIRIIANVTQAAIPHISKSKSISKLNKMKVLIIFFLKVLSPFRALVQPLYSDRFHHSIGGHNRRENACLNQIFNVLYQHLNNGDYPKPNWDFSYIALWGVGISNDPNDHCRKSPHIFSNLNNGGSYGYIN